MLVRIVRRTIYAVVRQSVSLTVDVEDYSGRNEVPRLRDALEPLLHALSDKSIKATFFVVGELAPKLENELQSLAEGGHEIGLHGYTHRHLKELGPKRFTEELDRGRRTIQKIVGIAPDGFRAPVFSLTAETPWAPDLISRAGFSYSSSVLPAWNPQAGLSTAPRQPFRWPSGLLELPAPVLGIGRIAFPVLGGAYLRLAPNAVVNFAGRTIGQKHGAWTYCHPYDFDAGETYFRRSGESWLFSRLLFARRSLMLRRVLNLIGNGSMTMREIAADPATAEVAEVWDFVS